MESLELLDEYTSFLEKKKGEGKEIIAFMAHDNIPEELFYAAGYVPLKMIFSGNDELINESHDYLPASTCSFAQSCIGLFSLKPGKFTFLDSVDYFLVSNHCVTDVCASEIISNYFFIPRLNFFSSYTQCENSFKYFKLELIELKERLEKISGKEITNESILDAFKKYNDLRKMLSEVNQMNIKGSYKLEIFQKGILFGPDYIPELRETIEKLGKEKIKETNDSKDILLTGCSIFIGDYLNNLIEESGGNIIFFDTWVGFNYFSQLLGNGSLDEIGDPLNIFVERFKNNIRGDHTVPNFLENKLDFILKYCKEYKERTGKELGVVNHIIKFCDHISIFQSTLKNKLQEEGIRVLNLERDYSRANRGQLMTRIEAFLEMM